MDQLPLRFRQYIEKHNLFVPKDQLLVAVSGGIDSVVLTDLLVKSGYALSIAHCNFQLRGAESDKDEQFVADFAQRLKIPFHVKSFNTAAAASSQKISTQMAARNLRYGWFEQLLVEKQMSCLITAHHADDQVETVLFNLAKGTGIAGLRGMKIVNDKIIRPLLFATKEEISDYAIAHHLDWRRDSSNDSHKYHRNRIRHQVIPALKEVNLGLLKSIDHTITRMGSLEKLLNAELQRLKNQYLKKVPSGWVLDLEWYDDASGGLVLLEEILKPFGFNLTQCLNLQGSLNEPGKHIVSDSHEVTVDRNQLFISTLQEIMNGPWSIEEHADFIKIEGHKFDMESVSIDGFEITKSQDRAQLDYDRLHFPLTVRRWNEGDRFSPLGMSSQKKLSDFMIDAKIAVNLKKRLLIFESNDQIIWIAGHQIDDRFKITKKTKNVFVIKMSHD